MASVQIQLVLDDKGVITGLRAVGGELDNLKTHAAAGAQGASKHLGEMTQSTRDAANMADLLAAKFGVAIPGGLSHMIAKFPAVAGGLKALAGVAGGFIAALTLMEVVNGLDKLDSKLRQVGNTWAEFGERVRGWFTGSKSDTAAMNEVIAVQNMLKPLEAAQRVAQNAAGMAGLTGYAQLAEARKQALAQIVRDTNDAMTVVEKTYTRGSDAYKLAQQQSASYGKTTRIAVETAANKELEAMRREHAKTIAQIEYEAGIVGLSEISKLRAQQEHDDELARDQYKRGEISLSEFKRTLTANDAMEEAKERDLKRKALQDNIQQQLQADAAGAKGEEQIRLQLVAQLQAITMKERETGLEAPGARAKAEADADAKIKELRRANLEETTQMEAAAALAMVAPWQRSDAEIFVSAGQRIRAIDQAQRDSVIGSDEAARRTAAVWQEASGKVLDSWTSAFEELFNGGWSKRIENNAKQFMARIAAQLTLQSGLGPLLGPILGLPSGMPGMTNVGFGAGFGGSTLGLGALGMGGLIPGVGGLATGTPPFLGFGAGTAAASGFPLLAGGSTNAGGYNVNAVNQLLGVPALSGAAMAGSGGKGMLGSLGGLASMLPLLAGGYLGGKLGGTPGMIGGGILGLMATLGIKSGIWSAGMGWSTAGLGGGALAGVGGGLLGFGIGQQYGTAAGTLSGAGSGALMGLMFGGPVGAIIGGIVGLLGGLFGGLFGGSQRDKQAKAFVAQQKTAADQIEAQFKSFQLDYPTALADLEQIRTNAYDQLRKLKDEGVGNYRKYLVPYIDRIEGELKGYEDERERRSTLAFAPPQFALGGTVMGYGGGVRIIAHPGEEIINPAASARNRPLLKAINSGASVSTGGGDVHIHLHTIDGASTMSWLKNGGGDVIASYARGRRLEGRSF